jgi:LysR family transcriptional regulator, nod-box dependent transcriptional activator
MNLRQFDLNLLVALDVLLTERNVTRAGERLFLSQPAMSGTLSRLRHLFADELLVRVGRRLEQTPLAAELAGPVHECVTQIEDLMNLRRPFAPATEQRSFRIAASDYVVSLLLAPLVSRVSEQAPNIAFRFVSLDQAFTDRVAAGTVDFAVLPAGIDPTLPSVPLFEDTWVCVVSANHPSVGERLTVEEYLALPHLVFGVAGPGHGSVADDHLADFGYERKIVASTESLANAPFLVQGTRLATLVPKRVAERLQQAANIKLIESPLDLPPLRETLVWSPRFTQSAAHVWMRNKLVELAKLL